MSKNRRAHVVFDLSAAIGTAKFVPAHPLPRRDKRELELYVAQEFTHILRDNGHAGISGVRSNPEDPPDILFEFDSQTRGLEISELVPKNRLEQDSIIQRFKQDIIQNLILGPQTRDWVVTVTLHDDDSKKLRLRFRDDLVALLNEFFSSPSIDARREATFLRIPTGLQSSVWNVHVSPWDLSGDPRIGERNQPLVTFTAQHVRIDPEDDLPVVVKSTIGRKIGHDCALPTWLVLWSNHYALGPFKKEVVYYINKYVSQRVVPYSRLFYLHLHGSYRLTEFLRLNRIRPR